MPNFIVVDSGPLVAAFDAKDAYHLEAVNFFENNKSSLVTSDYVITEVSYFLGRYGSLEHRFERQDRFLGLISDERFITRLTVSNDDLKGALAIMEKYKDLPADLTDAILVNYCINNNLPKIRYSF